MNAHQIELCLRGVWPTSVLGCPFPLTQVGYLILMAFNDKALAYANSVGALDFQEYVTNACRIVEPDWPLVASLAVRLGVTMSNPKVNKFAHDYPFPW